MWTEKVVKMSGVYVDCSITPSKDKQIHKYQTHCINAGQRANRERRVTTLQEKFQVKNI